MPILHPDSSAIDRVGLLKIREHFSLSRQAAHYWRIKGVPKAHRASLKMLGESLGHKMPEMVQMRHRLTEPTPTSGKSPTSPATPA